MIENHITFSWPWGSLFKIATAMTPELLTALKFSFGKILDNAPGSRGLF